MHQQALGTDYYVHPSLGHDSLAGTSKAHAFRTLKRVSQVKLLPGDRILLASGETYLGSLSLVHRHGSADNPILISTTTWGQTEALIPATINFQGKPQGILLEGATYIHVSQLSLTGNGYQDEFPGEARMRCGVLIHNQAAIQMGHIRLSKLHIFDVFFENKGFTRGKEEVRTPNGTQRYGWGIRVINQNPAGSISNVHIEDCDIRNVSHTGIKLTGHHKHIHHIYLTNNQITATGGPGIQMSRVHDVFVRHNMVSYSGSPSDSRKWGRGSGLWTWGSSRVLIEHNSFSHANGPGDSAGAHIDFDCDNIFLQYNISAYNAGGFCEVLGNTYNCAYRYNLSINDGHRIKGVNGAFQEGKTLWLSGYQGRHRPRKGPVNFYCYNNTIYCDSSLLAKVAIDRTSRSILIANNIFYIKRGFEGVLGDQYRPDRLQGELVQEMIYQHNVFLSRDTWPSDLGIPTVTSIFADPAFKRAGGDRPEDYMPTQPKLVKARGMSIDPFPHDSFGLWQPLSLTQDMLGTPTLDPPNIGAIVPLPAQKGD